MKKLHVFAVILFTLITACSPKITTNLYQTKTPLAPTETVAVISLSEAIPENAEELGEIKIGDTGFSTNCTWEAVIKKAQEEARKVGGNAIKIIEHIPPSVLGSSCHRIKALILKVDNAEQFRSEEEPVTNADFATLKIYRFSGAGSLVNYDLHLGDSIICRIQNNSKMSIEIKDYGQKIIWAKTESKTELPIEIQAGKTYYIRCGITMGFFVGHPSIQLVDYMTGKNEFESIRPKRDN